MCVVVSPTFATYATSCKVVHTLLDALIAQVVIRAEGVDFIRSNLTEVFDEFGHFIDAAPKFITKSEHTEGWMMAVGAQDILALFMQEVHQERVLIVEIAPEGKLRL